MYFDFPIDSVEIQFEKFGECQINILLNGEPFEGNVIPGKELLAHNTIRLNFTKNSPDPDIYARLTKFCVNGGDFTEDLKSLDYVIHRGKHPDAEPRVKSNLYFGYFGHMEIVLDQTEDRLKKAAWTIANEEFQPVKWPLRENMFRTKTFDTVLRDAKFMFTGCQSPFTSEIADEIDSMSMKDLRVPINDRGRRTIERWINDSDRITINSLGEFESFVPANGVTDCLRNFLTRSNLYMPSKMYFLNKEMLGARSNDVKDVFTDPLEQGANVLFEFPSPWYSNEELMNKINEARDLGCYVALDLTWLAMTNENIIFDTRGIGEIYFSMNKTWPIQDLRPAFRWCRKKLHDDLEIQNEYGLYTKANVQVFMSLLKKFSIDYVFDKYKQDAYSIREKFGLTSTPVLWFTTRPGVQHDNGNTISEHYFLDDFVSIVNLIQYKGKYFW